MIKLIILVSFLSTIFAGSTEQADWLKGWLLPAPGVFIWTLITFGIVLFILKWQAWGPLMSALEEREKRISEALSSADKAKEEAEKVSDDYDKMIQKAQSEAQDIVAKSKEAGEKLKNDIEATAKEKADQLMDKTKKEIDSARAQAVDEIKSISVDLAIQAASKVISKNLDDSQNRDIAKKTINEAN